MVDFKKLEIKEIKDVKDLGLKFPHKPKSFRKTAPTSDFDEQFLEDVHDEGLDLMDEDEFKKAIKEFKKITDYSFNPYLADDFAVWYEDAWNHIGECLLELGDPKKAKKIFQQLVKDDPDEITYQYNYALSLGDLGKNKEARDIYLNILKKEPDDLDSLVNISDEYIALQNPKLALKYAEKALKIKPNEPAALANKGTSFLMMHRFDLAKKFLDKSLKLDPDDGLTWFAKAVCLHGINADKDDIFDALVVATSLTPEIKKEKMARDSFGIFSDEKRYKKIFS